MSQNIFENAKFGDRFRTRDGRMAIFMSKSPYGFKPYCFIIENRNEETTWYDEKGCSEIGFNTNFDIVSRWEESIDEDKLDMLSDEYATKIDDEYMVNHPNHNWDKESVIYHWPDLAKAFESGYRAAKQE